MDLLYLAYYLSLFAGPVIIYVVFVKKTKTGPYSRPVWYYAFKKLFARTEVSRLQDYARHTLKNVPALQQELPRQIANEYESESVVYYAADVEGNHFILKMWLKSTMHMDVSVTYRTKEGQIYKLSGEPTVKTFSVSARQWKAGGLSIEILDPLKNLRITYRGHMTTTDGQKEYINYNFFWTAGTIPIHHPQDVNIELLTDGVAREPWRDGEWINMLGEDRGFEQYGVLHGFFNTSSEEIKVYMPSWRRRRWGPIDSLAIKRDFCIFGVQKDGTIFCVGARSMRVGSTQLRYGSILLNNGELKSISGSDISLEDLGDNMNVPSVFTFHFEAASKTIKCVAHVNTKRTLITTCEDQRGWIEKTTNAECDLNSEQAVAIVNFWYKRPGPGVKLPPPLLSPSSIENPEEVFIASLTSPQALDLSITGGKGNSLALLSSMQSNDFIVPPGFVVTVTSFKKHLEENPSLIDGLEYLQNVCCGVVQGNPEETCKKITEVFTNTPISEEISDLIKEEIRALKKECDDTDWTWAVRSSGVGEDSEELSAAGQNSTFLGCKSDDDVIKGVQACWGSLFAFQSVEYRRQHGLPIRCDMGVVVQKMVPADTAGVLFTCHPATGNPSQMVITSNYGLGESVVSASADPDTITLSRSFDDVLKIHTTVIGAKKTQITLGASNGIENTEEKEIEEALAGRLSISEQEAMLLGRVGVRLEEAFGNPRDIEWAFCDGRLYLLQSRPITTLATWTDWELTHEFDTPVFSNENIYTRANVGEVVKGAVTPLTQSFTMNFLDQVMQEEAYQVSKDIRKTLVCNSHFVFLDVLNFLYSKVSPTISLEHVVTDLAIFGHQVLNEDLLRTALHKHGPFEGYEKLKYNLGQFDRVRTNLSVRDRAVKLRDSWAIYVKDSDTPSDIFEKIEINAPNLASSLKCHTSTTTSSIIYQMITMIVLAEKHKEFNTDHYHDISLLLATNSDVESAEVPLILERVAADIRSSGLAEEFIKINPQDGLKWLQENSPKNKEIVDKFLTVHGHRTFREFELFESTWDMQPEMVISMIQSNCITDTTTKKAQGLTVDETISRLISPKSKITKSILKFVVKKCRSAVAIRETTKSIVVRSIHKFRLAFRKLAKSMVANGYIPHEDLLFFFTRHELRTHLNERNPTLVAKAIRRRRMFDRWNALHFPELSIGVPIPEEESSDVDFVRSEDGVKVQGTPVCKGHIVGRVCVITDIKNMNQIKPGDILITFSTDIAWSPYFPILSGVVTEIGGLISHGAVVAREYGLPCIVGAQHATKYFKTGDKVLLDGKTGLIELVE